MIEIEKPLEDWYEVLKPYQKSVLGAISRKIW